MKHHQVDPFSAFFFTRMPILNVAVVSCCSVLFFFDHSWPLVTFCVIAPSLSPSVSLPSFPSLNPPFPLLLQPRPMATDGPKSFYDHYVTKRKKKKKKSKDDAEPLSPAEVRPECPLHAPSVTCSLLTIRTITVSFYILFTLKLTTYFPPIFLP